MTTDNLAGMTLWVQGGDVGGSATLTWASGLTNAGTVTLQSADHSWWDSWLAVSGTALTNAPGGVIDAEPGSGGGRSLTGALTNQGTLHVGAGTGIAVGGAAPALALAGGAL